MRVLNLLNKDSNASQDNFHTKSFQNVMTKKANKLRLLNV